MSRSNYPEDEKIPVKIYGFTELGLLYNPDLQPASAAQLLKRWINHNTQLAAALVETGWCKGQRKFTPLQTGLIFRFLGEP